MVLAHGGTAGLLLESLGVAVPLLIIWFVRFRKPGREAAVAARPGQRPAPRQPARRRSGRPSAAKRRR
jgi:hypothetical protein